MQTNPPRQDDPVLIALDEAFTALNRFRDAYTRHKQFTDSELGRLKELSRGSTRRSTFNVEQTAERFAAEASTVRNGSGKFWCLRQAAYKPGVRLLFPVQAVEAHERNLMERGECGVCFKTVKPKK